MDRFAALEAFIRIVELGSFTACAKDLRLRQATVSRWIADLEDELGVQLLDRTTRAVRVTDAGSRFYEDARAIVGAWATAQAQARQQQAHVTGRLRVSVPVVFGQRFITPNLARFIQAHPALELELLFSDRYIDLVGDGVDLALRVGQPIDSEHRVRTLGITPRRLVAAPSLFTRHAPPQHPDELGQLPCLLHSGLRDVTTWSFERQGKRAQVKVSGPVSANHSQTLLELARAGVGVALLASWLVDDAIASGELVALLPEYEAPKAPIQALYASTRHTPRAIEAMIDFLQETLQHALPELKQKEAGSA